MIKQQLFYHALKNIYYFHAKFNLNLKKKNLKHFHTGVSRAKMTSRISSQPLNDNTSNRANIPLPSESKLKRRGLALYLVFG